MRQKEEIWLSSMTKTLVPTEMSNGQSDNTKRHKNVRLHSDCEPTKDGQLDKLQYGNLFKTFRFDPNVHPKEFKRIIRTS